MISPDDSKEAADASDMTHNGSKGTKEDIEKARERQAWRTSPEYARVQRTQRLFLPSLIACTGLGALGGWIYAATSNDFKIMENQNQYILYGAVIGLGACSYACLLLINTARSRGRRALQDRLLLGQAQEELKQVESEITGGATDFATLWAATQKRLDYYHQIATTQAERSFMYGQIAAAAGFGVIVLSAIIAGFSRTIAASIAAAVTGVSGGGLGAYIGSTFMKSQDAASTQLRAYFSQPLEFSKYLAAERLLTFIGEDNRLPAVNNMISSIMNVSPAQSSDKSASNGRDV